MLKQGTLADFLTAKAAEAIGTEATAAAAASPLPAAESGAAAAAASSSAQPAAASSRPSRACKQMDTAKAKPAAKAAAAKGKGKAQAHFKPQADSASDEGAGCSHDGAGLHDEHDEHTESAGDTFHCGVCEGRGSLLLCDGPCGRSVNQRDSHRAGTAPEESTSSS